MCRYDLVARLGENLRVTQSQYPHRFLAAAQLAIAYVVQMQWWDPNAETMTKVFNIEEAMEDLVTTGQCFKDGYPMAELPTEFTVTVDNWVYNAVALSAQICRHDCGTLMHLSGLQYFFSNAVERQVIHADMLDGHTLGNNELRRSIRVLPLDFASFAGLPADENERQSMQRAIECRGISYDPLAEELDRDRVDMLPFYPWEREQNSSASMMMMSMFGGQSVSQIARNLAPCALLHPANSFLRLPEEMKF